jgi:hypothetical protein
MHTVHSRSDTAKHWQTSRFDLDLSQPLVMGIVNVTPDSFSDGGQHAETAQALHHAEQLLRDGADILDIGAESTRPGAAVVPLAEELARLEPFLREAVRWQVPISVDTYKPEVMQAALDWGVDIINDIWALRQPGAQEVVAAHPGCGVCLMHMHRDPQTMQIETMAGDVLTEVESFLQARVGDLAKPWPRIFNCWPGSPTCCVWAIRSWRVGPESRHWVQRSARMVECLSLLKGKRPVWQLPCWRWSGAHPWLGCTMCSRRWRRSKFGVP